MFHRTSNMQEHWKKDQVYNLGMTVWYKPNSSTVSCTYVQEQLHLLEYSQTQWCLLLSHIHNHVSVTNTKAIFFLRKLEQAMSEHNIWCTSTTIQCQHTVYIWKSHCVYTTTAMLWQNCSNTVSHQPISISPHILTFNTTYSKYTILFK